MKIQNFKDYYLLYSAVVLMATSGVFAAVISLDVVTITQVRSVVAALGLLVFCYFRKITLSLASMRQLALVYGLGLLLCLHWVTYFHAVKLANVAVGMISVYTFPVMIVLLEPLFSKRRLRWQDVLAAALVLVGVSLMGLDGLQQVGEFAWGVVWGCISALFFALRNLVQKYYSSKVSGSSLMFHQSVATALILLPFVGAGSLIEADNSTYMMLIALGLLTTAGGHTLFSESLKRFPAKTVAMISCMQPVLGAIFAWFLLKQSANANILFGGCIVLGISLYESWSHSQHQTPVVANSSDAKSTGSNSVLK